jgi:hypothetical protein
MAYNKIYEHLACDAPIALEMPKHEELGKLITQTSGAISMINDSNYRVRSASGNNTHTVTATKPGWTCSCPDYGRYNAKCKHIYTVEHYHSQSATF